MFASHRERPWFNPQGAILWNWDSPVGVASLHWWPRRDWSLWPCLRQTSSQTVTRQLCRQCDNPTWSHTALLSRFHARCRSSFWLHNRHSCLPGGALWRACNLTAIATCLTGPVDYLFASRHEGPGFNPQGGTYVKPGFSCWHCLATTFVFLNLDQILRNILLCLSCTKMSIVTSH
jgi:hypothetical protein